MKENPFKPDSTKPWCRKCRAHTLCRKEPVAWFAGRILRSNTGARSVMPRLFLFTLCVVLFASGWSSPWLPLSLEWASTSQARTMTTAPPSTRESAWAYWPLRRCPASVSRSGSTSFSSGRSAGRSGRSSRARREWRPRGGSTCDPWCPMPVRTLGKTEQGGSAPAPDGRRRGAFLSRVPPVLYSGEIGFGSNSSGRGR